MLGTDLLAHGDGGAELAPLTATQWLLGWSVDPYLLVSAVAIAAAYLGGVRRLRRRGDRWSPWRSASFLAGGLGSILLATQSALGTYDLTLLSVHMGQHMVLNMVSPIFLALGAPLTLALRTLHPAGRKRLLAIMHSRVAAMVTSPLVAGALFVATPFALYFSGWYEATLRHEWLHELTHVHFVLVGALWFWPLLGVDPMPRRPPYPLRMLAAFATLPFHAFLGVALLSMNTLIAGDWYLSLGRDWGASALGDQRTAGGILWGTGDFTGILMFTVIFVQWMRASEREARREDRRLDRLEAAQAQAVPAGRVRPAATISAPAPPEESP